MSAAFFISDIHVGLQDKQSEELKLDKLERLFAIIRAEGRSLYMLGDIFDYWMEFRYLVPKGFTRLYGMLSDLVRDNIEVTYIAGNHDFYLGRFFDEELGVKTRYGLQELSVEGSRFILAHGDGLGKGDLGYKLFVNFIRTPFNIALLSRFHPDFAIGIMKGYSRFSRHSQSGIDVFETDRLLNFAESLAQEKDFDYFVCGHNHVQGIKELTVAARKYVNLGSWINGYFPYGVFEQGVFELRDLSS
jgi:UDP-2,3-diacylglucosamine hydrolase